MTSIKKFFLFALTSSLFCNVFAESNMESIPWTSMRDLPPGVQMAVLSGNPALPEPFIVRLKLPANYIMPAHSHIYSEQERVIAGTYYVGIGKVADGNLGHALHAGQTRTIPPNIKHYGFTKKPAIIEISSMGPWHMIYEQNG